MRQPSNWYDMSYSEQVEWTENERKHQRALEDAEYERSQVERAAEQARWDAQRAQQSARYERDELAEELAEARQEIERLRQRIAELSK